MKNISIFCFLIWLIFPSLGFSQSLRQDRFTFRGPVNPIDITYMRAKTMSLDIKTPVDFESNLRKFKGSLGVSSLETNLFDKIQFFDIKNYRVAKNKVLDGDIQVSYELKEFKIIDSKVITRAPGWIIGYESILSIHDNSGNLIYTRNTPLFVKTYLIDPTSSLDDLVSYLIASDFLKHFEDFSIIYLRQPVYDFYTGYFDLPKKDKNLSVDKAFIEKFNQSAEVFYAIEKVDLSQYNALFEIARPYWEGIRNFKESKDKGLNQDIQYAANMNLAVSYILVDQLDKAKPYLEAMSTCKSSLLFPNRTNELENWIGAIENAKRVQAKQKGNIVAIKTLDDNQFLSQSTNTLEKVTFDGVIKTQKKGELAGVVNILNDNPPLVDLRTTTTGSTLGNLASLLKTERNSIIVNAPGQKKAERLKMDELVSITFKNGSKFEVSRIGETMQNTDRYAILRELKKSSRLSLYVEDYPNSGTFLLKKVGQEGFFEIPSVVNRKKALLKYFEDCPAIHEKINNGQYLINDNNTYLKLFEDYNLLCK